MFSLYQGFRGNRTPCKRRHIFNKKANHKLPKVNNLNISMGDRGCSGEGGLQVNKFEQMHSGHIGTPPVNRHMRLKT